VNYVWRIDWLNLPETREEKVMKWQVDLLLPDQVTWYTAWTLDTPEAVGEVVRILCKYGQAGPARFQVRRLD
jgi:hypothetical protein